VKEGHLQNYIKEHPDLSWAPSVQYHLGIFYYMFHNYPKAEEAFRFFLKTYPDAPKAINAHYFLIRVYEDAGKLAELEQEAERFLQKYPKTTYTVKVQKKLQWLK